MFLSMLPVTIEYIVFEDRYDGEMRCLDETIFGGRSLRQRELSPKHSSALVATSEAQDDLTSQFSSGTETISHSPS